jgi:hypothetical protein
MDLGRLRAREVILGEYHRETEVRSEMGALAILLRRLLATRMLAASTRRRKAP